MKFLLLDLLNFYFPGWFAQNSFFYDSFEVTFHYFFTTPFISCVWYSVMEQNTLK